MTKMTAQAGTDSEPGLAVTQDGFLDGRFELLQPKKGLRAGTDAIFLAASIPANAGDTIVEAGVGTAAAALALLTRVAGSTVLGIENYPPHAALARKNAGHNNMADRLLIVEGDITAISAKSIARTGLGPPFDHAMANPPYYEKTGARPGSSASRRAAHLMPPGGLATWVENLSRLVRPGGSVTFIHQPRVLPELLAAMDRVSGAIQVLPLVPRAGAPATRVLVRGLRAAQGPAQLLSPLPLHEADGSNTCRSEAVLRGGEALDLDRLANRP